MFRDSLIVGNHFHENMRIYTMKDYSLIERYLPQGSDAHILYYDLMHRLRESEKCMGCGREIENPVFLCLDCACPKDTFLDDIKGFAMEKIMVQIMQK